MAAVMRLAGQAAISKLMAQAASSQGKSNKITQALGLLCAALAFTGMGFFVYGAHLWLAARYTPDVAALYTGVVAFLLMLVVAAAILAYEQYRRQKMKLVKRAVIAKIEDVMDELDDEIGDPIRNHPKTAVAVSSLAGFLVGERL